MRCRFRTRTAIATAFLAVLVGGAVATASAEVPRALFYWGQPFPFTGPDHVVRSVDWVTTNSQGGWLAKMDSGEYGPAGPNIDLVSVLWGSSGPGTGSLIRTETQVDSLYQSLIFPACGIDDAGKTVYRTWSETVPGGFDRLDTIWLDDEILALEGTSHPSLPAYWTFLTQPGITADGEPWWYGELSTSPGGPTTLGGLFMGHSATPILYSHDSVPNLPLPLAPRATEFVADFSSSGSHWIAIAYMDTPLEDDMALVIDGAGVVRDSLLYRRDHPVPASVGAPPNSIWSFFHDYRINDSGDWFAGTHVDSIPPLGGGGVLFAILENGIIRLRSGDFIDGYQIPDGEPVNQIAINDDGDLAYSWTVLVDGSYRDVVVLNDRIVLADNDPIDLDGDGLPDSPYLQDPHWIALSERNSEGQVTLMLTARTTVNFSFQANVLLTMTLEPTASTAAPSHLLSPDLAIHARPNPFTTGTRFVVRVPRAGAARVLVTDVAGRLVRHLVEGDVSVGLRELSWDGRNDQGARVAAGVYYVRLEHPAGSANGTVVRLR